ncbi:MAG: hypothetical protein LBC86_01430 [Oscillospiraceae bacterium]|jgi:hypothetical protein|nr:hypothetical protein [Oscillospiraceae bacterium]
MKFIKLLIVLIVVSLTAITAGAAIDVQNIDGDFRSVLLDTEEAGLIVGHQYALLIEIEADSTTGFRVRYTDVHYNRFGDTENDALNSTAAMARGQTATQIPARFDIGTIISGNTGIITIFFTHGIDLPDVPFDPEFSYIGVYGIQGGWGYEAIGVLLSDVNGNVLAEYGSLEGATPPPAGDFPDAPAPPPPPPEPESEPEPEPGQPVTDNQPGAEDDEPAPPQNDDAPPPPAPAPQNEDAPPPAPAQTSGNAGKTSPLLIFLIVAVAVIFGGATGGAFFLKKG